MEMQDARPCAVVFDLEFTAWEGSMAARWLRPGEFKEIVQIGAVRVDENFSPLDRFETLVRPRIHPQLSPYLEGIIGISNADIAARGVAFADAWRGFSQFVGALPLVAYGRDDLVLAGNLRLCGLDDALPPYTNVIDWLLANNLALTHAHGCDIGPAAGVAFAGHPHNALDDTLSLAAGIRALMARGVPSPLHKMSLVGEADRIAAALNLSPHPEGGAFVEIFRDAKGTSGRAHSTAIYFLLRTGEMSRKHRIDAAEVWHFYKGAPLELILDVPGKAPLRQVLGANIEAGERPQIVVPPQAWQSARSLGDYTLVGCTVAPGFEFSKFELE
jgi:uncharacterized protein